MGNATDSGPFVPARLSRFRTMCNLFVIWTLFRGTAVHRMKNRQIASKFPLNLSYLILTLLALLTLNSLGAEARRPNIIFVLVDDLRWDALGCMGHPIAKTPNIDRIANEGAL